ncbi:MAG TPA: NAD(P)/FAD-dependent oxidoreductase [Rhodanobacteraceae bacterium]|nr:NAD(P)/FAD-dependent oxidoreductase [Rhodanobacteraceae bacterium]
MQQADTSTDFDCDVLVIGGGPGGSTISALLAQRGWRVMMLERDRHPRFHIGESLLPANLPIFEEIGALEKLRAIGRLKLGADFPRDDGSYYTFRFDRALGGTPHYSFHVLREELDRMLFEHAREQGVDAHEGAKVERVDFNDDGLIAQVNDNGAQRDVRARYLVDASGRDTFLGKQFKLVKRSKQHQSAAVFAHYRGVAYNQGDDQGNIISVYRFQHGWAWFIPLPSGEMSIGCVCKPEYLKTRRGADNCAFLAQTLAMIPNAQARLAHAQPVSEVRVTGNYSYACARMCGRRWIMIGDAWAFLDPIFSSGVFLAMHSAKHALEVVDGALRDPAREPALQRAFAKRLRAGYTRFAWFIYRFNSPVMKALFANPRNVWRVEEGVVSMLAGDVFDDKRVLLRLKIFKFIYAVFSLANLRRWATDLRERRRQNRMAFTP